MIWRPVVIEYLSRHRQIGRSIGVAHKLFVAISDVVEVVFVDRLWASITALEKANRTVDRRLSVLSDRTSPLYDRPLMVVTRSSEMKIAFHRPVGGITKLVDIPVPAIGQAD